MENLMEVGQNHISLKCEICDKEFKNNRGLKYHFNMVHNLGKECQCNICQKIFNSQNKLTQPFLLITAVCNMLQYNFFI